MTLHVKRYPSVAAMARDAEAINPFHLSLGQSPEYFGYEQPADSVRLAISGDTSRVAEAEKLLGQITAEIDIPERPWTADCAGAYPVVPEFLAGMPDCMRRRATVENDESPIRIACNVSVSMSLDADQVMRRGCAVLALVMALSRVRPVELLLYSAQDVDGSVESLLIAPINTAPLDLATAAYTLTSAGFLRRIVFNLHRHHHFGRRRCTLDGRICPEAHARLREMADLIVPFGRVSDPLINDPVAWVNARIAESAQ